MSVSLGSAPASDVYSAARRSSSPVVTKIVESALSDRFCQTE
ncbi:hypothetical protein [Hyphomonas sp.]|nr:hypothetical protein [Hyphomonas sp.]